MSLFFRVFQDLVDERAGTFAEADRFAELLREVRAAERQVTDMATPPDEEEAAELQALLDAVNASGVFPEEDEELRARLKQIEAQRADAEAAARVGGALGGGTGGAGAAVGLATRCAEAPGAPKPPRALSHAQAQASEINLFACAFRFTPAAGSCARCWRATRLRSVRQRTRGRLHPPTPTRLQAKGPTATIMRNPARSSGGFWRRRSRSCSSARRTSMQPRRAAALRRGPHTEITPLQDRPLGPFSEPSGGASLSAQRRRSWATLRGR